MSVPRKISLAEWDERFSSVIDSGLFHIYSGEEREKYVKGLKHVLGPGGRVFLYCFSEDPSNPGGGVSIRELYDAFADGWEIETLAPSCGNAEWKMMFAIIRRKE